VEGGYDGRRFWLKCTQYCSAKMGAPLPGKVCKVFIAGDLGLDCDGYAVLKSLQSIPRLVKSSFLCLKAKSPDLLDRAFRFSFLLFLL
jgi:hypothetical protein